MSVLKILEEINNFDEKNIEQKYKDYLTKVRPMTGAGVVKLLNLCAKNIDDDKCYLEVGTHRGSTLLGAALDHNKLCYGVDNFLGHNSPEECYPFSSIEEGLCDAIKNVSNGNVNYFKCDYLEFFNSRKDVNGKKVEVYLYDGDHGSNNQYLGIKCALPLLADDAIILVDDSAQQDSSAVWYGIDRCLKEEDSLSFVTEFYNDKPNDLDGMWNGIAILRYQRNPVK